MNRECKAYAKAREFAEALTTVRKRFETEPLARLEKVSAMLAEVAVDEARDYEVRFHACFQIVNTNLHCQLLATGQAVPTDGWVVSLKHPTSPDLSISRTLV
jgi:hypothetical protein